MDKHTIINLKQKGLSNRKVALLTNIDRKTVATYWNEFNDCLKKLKEPEADTLIIQEEMASAPKYQSSNMLHHRSIKLVRFGLHSFVANTM